MNSQEFEDVVQYLRSTPEKVRRLVSGVSAQQLCLKPSPAEFSILEHLCHLRDIEVEGYVPRFRRILSEEKPFLPDIDGSKLAIERNYQKEDLEPALEVFSRARDSNLQLLKGVSQNQLNREGDLEGRGKITLWQLLKMQRKHDEEHLQELGILSRQKSENTR